MGVAWPSFNHVIITIKNTTLLHVVFMVYSADQHV